MTSFPLDALEISDHRLNSGANDLLGMREDSGAPPAASVDSPGTSSFASGAPVRPRTGIPRLAWNCDAIESPGARRSFRRRNWPKIHRRIASPASSNPRVCSSLRCAHRPCRRRRGRRRNGRRIRRGQDRRPAHARPRRSRPRPPAPSPISGAASSQRHGSKRAPLARRPLDRQHPASLRATRSVSGSRGSCRPGSGCDARTCAER